MRGRIWAVAIWWLWLGLAGWEQGVAGMRAELPIFHQVAGEIRTVRVAPGDTLLGIAGRVGVPASIIARMNGLKDPNRLWPGQELRIDTRRIVPSVVEQGWVVNVPEAGLYVFDGGGLVARYPVGLGRPGRPTPLGSFRILYREDVPSAPFPSSLQEELIREGRVVQRKAAPDSDTSLGRYWIQLSIWGYGVYASRFSASIGQFLGNGCIRVASRAMASLFGRATKGTRVEVTYFPIKVAITREGRVWVEVHPDVYGLGTPDIQTVVAALQKAGVPTSALDRATLSEVLLSQDTVARVVGTVPAQIASRSDGEQVAATDTDSAAVWRCLDCPPPPGVRRITFQIEAREPIELPNPYPIEILDDGGRVVFRPAMVAQTVVPLKPGETRNFVWEMRDSTGQPLPPGSYTAIIRFFRADSTQMARLSLPLWVGR